MSQDYAAPDNKIQWRVAWKALKEVIADPDRTDQVFVIIGALSGKSFEKSFRRFRATPGGQRLLAERPSLLAALSDQEALAALPDGSFGRAYHEFMTEGGLTADGLIEAQAQVVRKEEPVIEEAQKFYGDRLRDMHDLWHVLSGYGRDEAGEAANLAFTQGQIPNKGVLLIVIAAAIVGPRTLAWPGYLFRAWRRGRRAAHLPSAAFEELLPLPLAEVRERLAIEHPNAVHPEGIFVLDKEADELHRVPAGAGAPISLHALRTSLAA